MGIKSSFRECYSQSVQSDTPVTGERHSQLDGTAEYDFLGKNSYWEMSANALLHAQSGSGIATDQDE